ncbi:MAG: hypothetical protein LBJ90_02195 [Treponema sp.]|jgi:hypothetical protein|nr:hypothetical protein [Treponema sp.]
MDFRIFSISRDLLCLSGALTGLAVGCLLSLFRKDLTTRSKNRRISVILVFFSGAIIALAASFTASYGAILREPGFFIVAGICIPVFALAARFPRAIAYPLILAGGLITVGLGYSYLRFPPADSSSVPPALISGEGKGPFSIRVGDRAEKNGDGTKPQVLQIPDDLLFLEFNGAVIGFGRYYPIIGGTRRGQISEIRQNNKSLYSNTDMYSSLLGSYSSSGSNAEIGNFGISFQSMKANVPFETIPQGGSIAVLFDKNGLLFVPSWQDPR